MAEAVVPLEVLGISLAFKVLDESERAFTTGTIPIHEDDVKQFEKATLIKYICEKCNEGELIFNPSEHDNVNEFTHTCTNCENVEIFDRIYPSMNIIEEKELDKVKSFKISFTPEYYEEDTVH